MLLANTLEAHTSKINIECLALMYMYVSEWIIKTLHYLEGIKVHLIVIMFPLSSGEGNITPTRRFREQGDMTQVAKRCVSSRVSDQYVQKTFCQKQNFTQGYRLAPRANSLSHFTCWFPSLNETKTLNLEWRTRWNCIWLWAYRRTPSSQWRPAVGNPRTGLIYYHATSSKHTSRLWLCDLCTIVGLYN